MKNRFLSLMVVLALGIAPIISCSSGGGGGTVVDDGSYTGVTTQAQITADNAVELAVGTWDSATTGTAIDILGAAKADIEFSKNPFSLGLMPFIFEDIVNGIKFKPLTTEAYLGAAQTINDIITGACNDDGTVEGNATIDGSGDDSTGEFTATIDFNNYCEYEGGGTVVINGQASISGNIAIDTIEDEFPMLSNYTLTFTSLTIEYFETSSITINGSFSANYTVSPMLITMSYVLKNNITMETYWLRDLQVSLISAENYVDITMMTGRYYHPEYGYVEISIGDTIRIYDADFWPSTGSYVLTGAQNTKDLLTFVDATQFMVEADTDGDGENDFTSGPYSWADWPDNGGSPDNCENVAGMWTLNVFNIDSSCGPESPWQSIVNISQDNCSLTTYGIKETDFNVPGSVSGNDVTIGPGTFEDGPGFTTSTFTMTLDTTGKSMIGIETWTWISTDETETCTGGRADTTATKLP